MKKTIIIVIIAVLAVVAISLGIVIVSMPEPVPPAPVDIHTDNSIITTLGIERPYKHLERLIALVTYQGATDKNRLLSDMIKIGQVGNMEYLELDEKSNDYLLITPFEINGKLEISTLKYLDYYDAYAQDTVIFAGNKGQQLPDNYSLLIRYSRPSLPQYQIKLTQMKDGEVQTATYKIVDNEAGYPVKTIQFIKDDIEAGTESIGDPIKMPAEIKR